MEVEGSSVVSLKYDQVLTETMNAETIDNETKLRRGALL